MADIKKQKEPIAYHHILISMIDLQTMSDITLSLRPNTKTNLNAQLPDIT